MSVRLQIGEHDTTVGEGSIQVLTINGCTLVFQAPQRVYLNRVEV